MAGLKSLHLGFSPKDISELIRIAGKGKGKDGLINFEQFSAVFNIPEFVAEDEDKDLEKENAKNRAPELDGALRPPPGKWACATCTVFNSDSAYFCECCNTARPKGNMA